MKEEKKRPKYFKTTSCKDKRSVVRGLNTFSEKFEYIICNKTEVDIDIEPITFIYSDEERYNGIIFSKKEAAIKLQDTELILETIDNLISINRQIDLKESLKESVKKRDYNGINNFFINENLSLAQMSQYIDSEEFALKIFNQIKNRIMFARSGIYTTNNSGSTVKNRIKVNPATFSEIMELEINYVIDKLWLFDSNTVERVREVRQIISEDKKNKYYDENDTPDENNTTLFQPIDEEVYLDPDATPQAKKAAMPTPMILREEYDMYDEQAYKDYDSFVADYDFVVDEIKSYIKDFLVCLEEKEDTIAKIKEHIKLKMKTYDDYCLELFDTYLNTSSYKCKLELLEFFPDFTLLHKFFAVHEVIGDIIENEDNFLRVLKSVSNTDIDYDVDEAEAQYEAYIEQLVIDKTEELNKVKSDTLEKYSTKLKQIKEDSIYMSYEFFRDLYNETLFKKKEFERLIDLELELYEQFERNQQDKDTEYKYNIAKKEREELQFLILL